MIKNVDYLCEKSLPIPLEDEIPEKHLENEEEPTYRDRKLFLVVPRLPIFLELEGDQLNFVDNPAAIDLHALVTRCLFDLSLDDWSSTSEILIFGLPIVTTKLGQLVNLHEESSETKDKVEKIFRTRQMIPVFLTEKVQTQAFSFIDRVLMPLLDQATTPYRSFCFTSNFKDYQVLNEAFRDAVLPHVTSSHNLVLVHGSPVSLVPQLIREKNSELTIGFYMHSVFPSDDVYRVLPQREEILKGILAANVIGFHSLNFARNFMSSVRRLLGLECKDGEIESCEESLDTVAKVFVAPIGIDATPYLEKIKLPQTRARIQELSELCKGRKIILGVDTLDSKRGIFHKLLGFQHFLKTNPEFRTRCVLLQLTLRGKSVYEASFTPTRMVPGDTKDSNRNSLLEDIYKMVGEINAKYGSPTSLPVHFLDQPMDFDELVSLYSVADVFISSSLSDIIDSPGYAFVCCQDTHKGVLMLSEFSSSAQSLLAGALVCNPWDTVSFAQKIAFALQMEEDEREERHQFCLQYILKHRVSVWFTSIVKELVAASSSRERLKLPRRLDFMNKEFENTNSRRILIFKYKETLISTKKLETPYVKPEELSKTTKQHLKALARDVNTEVVILSSCEEPILDAVFSDLDCWLVAGDGLSYRAPPSRKSPDWLCQIREADLSWMEPVMRVFQYYSDRTPGSHITTTEYSLTWNYSRKSEHGHIQAKELFSHLWSGPIQGCPAEALLGRCSVQVRPTGISKAACLEVVLRRIAAEDEKVGFVCCIGKFSIRDEETYTVLQNFFPESQIVTCTIGRHFSRAQYYLRTAQDLSFLLARWSWTTHFDR